MRSGPVVLLLLFLLVAPGQAMAQGATEVDPDSPSGKEYAIPLERARSDAAEGADDTGGGGGGSDSGGSAGSESSGGTPSFGVGVTPEGEKENREKRRERRGTELPAGVEQPPSADIAAQVANPDGGGGQLAVIAGAGLGAVLLGGLAGFFLRGRSRA